LGLCAACCSVQREVDTPLIQLEQLGQGLQVRRLALKPVALDAADGVQVNPDDGGGDVVVQQSTESRKTTNTRVFGPMPPFARNREPAPALARRPDEKKARATSGLR
jgi:hypothetical protein